MDYYVVSFIFDKNFENVWLIKKEKPSWQKGLLNGIGGKIENGESPTQAAVRELGEESGYRNATLVEVGHISGTNNDKSPFIVYVFTGQTAKTLTTQEIEEIGLYPVKDIKLFPHMENIPLLIEACIYYLKGKSHFSKLILEY